MNADKVTPFRTEASRIGHDKQYIQGVHTSLTYAELLPLMYHLKDTIKGQFPLSSVGLE